MGVLASDNYIRSNSTGWGVSTGPNSGQTWAIKTGSGWTLTSNAGLVNSTSDNTYLLGTGTQGDVEGFCQSIAPGDDWFGPFLRSNAAGTIAYQAITQPAANQLALNFYSSGTRTNLQTASFTFTANHTYAIRFRVTGNTNPRCQARIWDTSGGEPGTWNIDFTDSSANKITAAGNYGLYGSDGASGNIKFTSASFNDTLSGVVFSKIFSSDSFSTISPGGGIIGS